MRYVPDFRTIGFPSGRHVHVVAESKTLHETCFPRIKADADKLSYLELLNATLSSTSIEVSKHGVLG